MKWPWLLRLSILIFDADTPASSNTSRDTHSSKDSPVSTNPAKVKKRLSGQIG